MNLVQLHGLKSYFEASGNWGIVSDIEGLLSKVGLQPKGVDSELKQVLIRQILELETWRAQLIKTKASDPGYEDFLKTVETTQASARRALAALNQVNAEWSDVEYFLKTGS